MTDERKQVVVRLPVPLIQRIGHLAVETGRTKQDTIENLLTLGLYAREHHHRLLLDKLENE